MTPEQARDAILDKFRSAWIAGAQVASGEDHVPLVEYDGAPADPALQRDDDSCWARVTVRTNEGRQRTLGPIGRRTFERLGTVTVQLFVPAGKRGLGPADRLAKLVLDAFEASPTSDSLWFRNARAREVGPDGAWYQVNVVAEFQYDEVK